MLATGAGPVSSIGGAVDVAAEEIIGPMVTVKHFTSAPGVTAIKASGNLLRSGTFVTLATEVEGMSAAEVETALEIDAGKGAFSTTFQTPMSNLMTPFNGPLTSGNAIQYQLITPTIVGPFVPTP